MGEFWKRWLRFGLPIIAVRSTSTCVIDFAFKSLAPVALLVEVQMNRREFMNAMVTDDALVPSAGAQNTAVPQRPNIVFILADDLGYGDLSSYGRPDYKTPVLDTMAKEGMKFTDAYASAPVCTPTRMAFHTGRYPHRLPLGLQEPLSDGNMQLGIPPDHPTIGTQLKKSGYDTILIGKWHLGNIPEFGPNRHGFDEFFGINGSSADYFTHYNNGGRPGSLRKSDAVESTGISHRSLYRSRRAIPRAASSAAVLHEPSVQRTALAVGRTDRIRLSQKTAPARRAGTMTSMERW